MQQQSKEIGLHTISIHQAQPQSVMDLGLLRLLLNTCWDVKCAFTSLSLSLSLLFLLLSPPPLLTPLCCDSMPHAAPSPRDVRCQAWLHALEILRRRYCWSLHNIRIFLWAACSLYASFCFVRCVVWGLSGAPNLLAVWC